MCSILAILELKSELAAAREQALKLSKRQRHRGPDWSGVFADERAILVHERLSIVDVESGAQPLYAGEDDRYVLAVNGEIYNHKQLRERLKAPYEFRTKSDCEVLLPLYRDYGPAFLDEVRGMFAFVLYDRLEDRYLIARDHMGIIPLYTGRDGQGNLYVASELKAIEPACRTVAVFPPAHYQTSQAAEPTRYWSRGWRSYESVAGGPSDPAALREALMDSVHCHLMSDVPYGVLLSGGLDSSITAAVAARYAAARIEDDDQTAAWFPRLHSFAIGLDGAPDLKAAKEVAALIGTVHHEFHYTVQDGLDALSDVIFHIETYDVTSIRASTPMYLMARMIKAMGVKMVLSGEGADEIFGGYLYFHKAPSARDFHEETVRKLDGLHQYDNLRANKSMAAWGVEARVPFLDKRFMDVAMSLDPESKMIKDGRQEKQILREAFKDFLPESIYKRQKEQFSDGVGYSWIDSLKAYADEKVSDSELENARYRFPYNSPETKEAYLYRSIFEEHFPLDSAAETVPGGKSVACSTPAAIAWDEAFARMADPSGRAVNVHEDAYKDEE